MRTTAGSKVGRHGVELLLRGANTAVVRFARTFEEYAYVVARLATCATRACVVGCVLASLGATATVARETRNVLALYSSVRTLPANVDGERGLRAAVTDTPARHVEFYTEFLDVPRFGGPEYVDTLTTFLRNKYAAAPPDVIFIGGDDALAFALANRTLLFPNAPMVHASVPIASLRSLEPLPADVIGDPVEFDSLRTIELAFRLHPAATQLILVTGTSEFDKKWEARLRAEAPRFPARVRPQFFAGLPTEALVRKLAMLGRDAVVFTPGYFIDGDGHSSTPRDAARLIAAASTAPVYGPFSTFIDTGVVGGFMPNYYDMGYRAGQSVSALLDGAKPTERTSTTVPTALNVDARQVRRWGIDPKALPGDAVVQFREPTLLEAYRMEVIAAAVVFILQSGLITGLVFERRRRRAAEQSAESRGLELAHASRLAIAGELTASIAHEINQPLGAILSNADAAKLILASDADRRDELHAILDDIRRDDRRASEVIRRLRDLLDNHAYERTAFRFDDVLQELNGILGAEARRRGVRLDIRPSGSGASILGDRIQIQQVLINLVLNAMDAMAEVPEERRVVVVSARRDSGRVAVEVRDNGRGIEAQHVPHLFDAFFTTKPKGMGLGLSIASRLVGTHGGRIWAENGTDGGAAFHVEWPTVEQSVAASAGAA
jgi:signal transduction histidine kinase